MSRSTLSSSFPLEWQTSSGMEVDCTAPAIQVIENRCTDCGCEAWRYGIAYLSVSSTLLSEKHMVIGKRLDSRGLRYSQPAHAIDESFARHPTFS